MRRHTSFSVQSTSGLYFQSPRRSSHSTGCEFARVGACSRRMPVIQASTPLSARPSAATLASLQQLSSVQGPRASSTSTLTPKRSSNSRQVASVSSNSTPVSIVTTRASGAIRISSSTSTDSSFWKEHSRTSRGWWRSTASAITGAGSGGILDRLELLRPPGRLGAGGEGAEVLAVVVIGLVQGEDPQEGIVELPVGHLADHDLAEARVGAEVAAEADVHRLHELAVDLLEHALDADVGDLMLGAAR